MKKALLYWFSFLLLLLLFTSCGTRKVQNTKSETQSENEIKKTDKTVVANQDTTRAQETKTVVQSDEMTIEKITYSPVDPTKPSSFVNEKGEKNQLNNATYTREKATAKSNKKYNSNLGFSTGKKQISQGNSTIVSKEKNKESTAVKKSERTSPSWWNLLWLLIPIGLYVFWKNKDKLWWI